MSNIEKLSVALTSEQAAALRGAVASGEYATTSEIIQEAVTDWRLKKDLRDYDIARLRELWDEGKAGGDARPLDMVQARREAREQLARAKTSKQG